MTDSTAKPETLTRALMDETITEVTQPLAARLAALEALGTSTAPAPAETRSAGQLIAASVADPTARAALEGAREELGFRSLHFNPDIGILSLVGAGMRSNPGVSARLFGALSEAGVNIHMISTSEIRISVVVDDAVLDEAVRAVHSAFGLDAQAAEAVVYGGTGR